MVAGGGSRRPRPRLERVLEDARRALTEAVVVPPPGWRLPPLFGCGTWARRPGGAARALQVAGVTVAVEVLVTRRGVRLRARDGDRAARIAALEDARFALALDLELPAVARELARHPLLRPIARSAPWLLLPRRAARPFEALAFAVCEQLIEAGRAAAIQRRLVARFGVRAAGGRGGDGPSPRALAAAAPAELEACGLSAGRALALRRAATAVLRLEGGATAGGRALRARWASDERIARRLLAIPGIGRWTVEKVALEGLGDGDSLPAADLAYLKLVGALSGLGRRASEGEVREFFAPFAPWRGLAGTALARAAWAGLLRPSVPLVALDGAQSCEPSLASAEGGSAT